MEIRGHGVDLVETEHFRQLCTSPERALLLARYFTTAELASASGGADEAQRLAGRFAAKEAVLKALGVGWTQGIALTDVEITSLESGAPAVRLHAECAKVAAHQGITSWLLSISHTAAFAIASALAVSKDDEA